MRRAAGHLPAAVLAAVLVAGSGPGSEAWAAFDLRDASPASLGAATLDREPMSMLGTGGGIRIGAGGSRFLSDAEVGAVRLDLTLEGARRFLACSVTQVGADFARETALRIALREAAGPGIALEISGERLDLRVEGTPTRGGWAAGGRAIATVPAGRLDVTLDLGCDRLFRSAGLGDLAVTPSLPFAITLRGPSGAVTWIDRWETGGGRSPRLVLDLALGGALGLRVARGSDPARTGIAMALRLARLEVAAGHLDLDSGTGLAGASIRYRITPSPRRGKPAAGSGALLL